MRGGGVKFIYIDPPYNTGHDFIYPDSFIMSNNDYNDGMGYFDENGNINYFRENATSTGKYYSYWCSMIYSRLMLARNLLKDDGVIFISIDDNEIVNLRSICNEIFGVGQFIAQITLLCNPKGRSQDKYVANCHEYILIYSKQRLSAGSVSIPKTQDEIKQDYPLFDEKGNPYRELELRNTHRDFGRFNRSGLWYPLYVLKNGDVSLEMTPDSEPVYPVWDDGFEGCWTWGKEKVAKQQVLLVGRCVSGKMKIYRKAYAFDGEEAPLKQVKSIWQDKNATVLDFFSGSATTAHAVMQLNAEDGGHRKFIMVQLPEPCDEKSEAYRAGYRNICEIGKERIRRAAKKIAHDNPGKEFDGGFRVFKLDDTNMRDVYYSADDYNQDMLSMLESNIKEDRTDLDLLFGCLLKWGLPLSLPYFSEIIDGYAVHTYNDGDLIACFDENVSKTVVETIARRQPLRAVFRDSSFPSSPAKINVGEIFKLLAPDTRVKVI